MTAKLIATWFTVEVGAGWVHEAPDDLPDEKSTYWNYFRFSFTSDPMKAHHFTAEQAKKAAWLLGGTARRFTVDSDKYHMENLSLENLIQVPRPFDLDRSFKPRDFSWALTQIKRLNRVYRRGWNGPGQHIRLQQHTTSSKMTLPYIYIVTVQGDLVPWLASQTDMLADDWEYYNEKR